MLSDPRFSDPRAKCLTLAQTVTVFFEDVWGGQDEHGATFDAAGLAAAREVCDQCPVRRQCFAAAMSEERGVGAAYRYGVRAGTTPLQRWSIEHRGSQTCPSCGTTLDPNSLRAGEVVCPEECAIDRTVPPIPDAGDRWTRRHTTLARKVIRWLVEEVPPAGAIPRPSALAEQWKERRSDMTRVYEALVTDGTLSFDGQTYRRQAVIVGAGRPPVRETPKQRRRRQKRERRDQRLRDETKAAGWADPGEWQPPHIMEQAS